MIDYSLIANSITYYESLGFHRVETPWTVTPAVNKITAPANAHLFNIDNGKCLVASGEQSFLYQYLKGFLPFGRFQTVTPCFRYEEFDDLHTKYFIKNELIQTDDVSDTALSEMLLCAKNFFNDYFDNDVFVTQGVEKGEPTFDILYRGVELGSYGRRKCSYLTWLYGTGCAEPRLSSTMKKFNGK